MMDNITLSSDEKMFLNIPLKFREDRGADRLPVFELESEVNAVKCRYEAESIDKMNKNGVAQKD